MNLAGKNVRFRLLPAGQEAVAAILSRNEVEFEGYVLDENHIGVWIWITEHEPANQAMLLRWEHFLTATVEWSPEPLMDRPGAGFRPT
jgi:hypothetical protein